MRSFYDEAQKNLINSGLFDPDWYSATYPDVGMSGVPPHEHFLRIGRRLGRHGSLAAATAYSGERSEQAQVVVEAPKPETSLIPEDLSSLIRRSRLFDEQWYSNTYRSLIRHRSDLVGDYITAFEADSNRDPGPLFSTSDYLEFNPDVRGMHPLLHLVEHGMAEGRPAFSARKVNDFLRRADHGKVAPLADLISKDRHTTVVSWKDGNFFFGEIGAYAATYLQSLGFPAEYDTKPSRGTLASDNLIVVAPHEFCVYGPGKDWPAEVLARAVYLNTEQWQTSWFTLTYNAALKSGKMLDMNPTSAAGFAELGFTCGFVPLLPLEGSCFSHEDKPLSSSITRGKWVKDLSYPDELKDRPYDLLFVGVQNKRRAEGIASLAHVLQAYDCFMHIPVFGGPVRANDPDMVSNSDLSQLARNSKILLNIHQGEAEYFEWHRLFLSGIMEGAVVVTEPCLPTGIVFPDEHYIEAELEDMPSLLDHLLGTEEGHQKLSRIHQNCLELRSEILSGGKLFK